jgi:hypothetical protein
MDRKTKAKAAAAMIIRGGLHPRVVAAVVVGAILLVQVLTAPPETGSFDDLWVNQVDDQRATPPKLEGGVANVTISEMWEPGFNGTTWGFSASIYFDDGPGQVTVATFNAYFWSKQQKSLEIANLTINVFANQEADYPLVVFEIPSVRVSGLFGANVLVQIVL